MVAHKGHRMSNFFIVKNSAQRMPIVAKDSNVKKAAVNNILLLWSHPSLKMFLGKISAVSFKTAATCGLADASMPSLHATRTLIKSHRFASISSHF